MIRMDLCGLWDMTWKNGETLKAQIPGSVLSTLLAAGKINDPFVGENEYRTLPLFDEDYAFERTFVLSPALLAAPHLEIVFEGLDTMADVYLNGRLLFCADNMHRTWRHDVRPFVRAGENRLRVFLHSPNRAIHEAALANPDITYDGTGYTHGTSLIRKAHCMFGWDWGPQLPDCGIWRPCYLEAWQDARITHVEILQEHAEGCVRVIATPMMSAKNCAYTLSGALTSPRGETLSALPDKNGQLVFCVENPLLWQPNGWGSQPLYDLTVTCLSPLDEAPQQVHRRIGLRTLRLVREKDEWGESFCFEVNGHRLFAMGADYIPEDNVLSRVTPQRTRALLQSCADAHFNCVRVWGGGYYPDDWFFDICDELGLIVWMDLMFACNVYKLTPAFEQSITLEAQDNLRRLHHHASLGLICGNNEMETAWLSWGEVKRHSERLRMDYLRQFEHVLKEVSLACAKQTPYWPSSPSSGGGFDDPNSFDRGDVHDWSVWHGMEPFESYQAKYPRFCSEFGFESFPALKTIAAYARPDETNIYSRVMESHQKCVGGNAKIISYVSQHCPYPHTLPHIVYASQLLQAEAIRYGVEHWRRSRGRCMGAIYWQLNDCWPVASWSSIDSFGRWKGLHYAARRFFAPVMLSCQREGTSAELNVVNDCLTPFEGEIAWQLMDASGKPCTSGRAPVQVPPLQSVWLEKKGFAPFMDRALLHPEDHYALAAVLRDAQGREVSRCCELFSKAKHFAFEKPHITAAFFPEGQDCVIEVQSDRFAWNVCLDLKERDCVFSDNWFFLLPGEKRRVLARGMACGDVQEGLTILSLADLMG